MPHLGHLNIIYLGERPHPKGNHQRQLLPRFIVSPIFGARRPGPY